MRAFPKPSGVLLECHTSGKLFNLSRLRAKSNARRLFICELLYENNAAILVISASTLQNLCNSFASACAEFNTTILLAYNTISLNHIHVGSGNFLGMQRIICPNFPKLA